MNTCNMVEGGGGGRRGKLMREREERVVGGRYMYLWSVAALAGHSGVE